MQFDATYWIKYSLIDRSKQSYVQSTGLIERTYLSFFYIYPRVSQRGRLWRNRWKIMNNCKTISRSVMRNKKTRLAANTLLVRVRQDAGKARHKDLPRHSDVSEFSTNFWRKTYETTIHDLKNNIRCTFVFFFLNCFLWQWTVESYIRNRFNVMKFQSRGTPKKKSVSKAKTIAIAAFILLAALQWNWKWG